jgi:hypothetical protein
MAKKEKPTSFHMRADTVWKESVAIASEVLGEAQTEIVEEGTRRYLKSLAKKNPKLKQALQKIAA